MSVAIARFSRELAVLLAVALAAAPAAGQADPSGVTWNEKVDVVSGGGYKGRWQMNESAFHYVDDPTVAINEQNLVAVAWVDQTRQDIFFQLYEPDGKTRFDAPVNVSNTPGIFSWLPRMVISSGDANEVYVLWQEIVFSGGSHGGEILFARSTDGGKTFSEAVNLSNSIAGDGKGRLTGRYWHNGSLDLAMDPRGDLYAAWTEYEGNLWFSRSTDGGGSFSKPLRISDGGDAKPARGPALAVAAGGAVHLAWTVGEDESADIRLATSGDHGQSFGAPRIATESDGHSDAPKIAVDGEGTIHLVYGESPGGPFKSYHIGYTRSTDGGRRFEEPREISGPQAKQFASVNFPDLSLDGEDNIYMIWNLFPRRGDFPRGLGFTYSSDGGRTFASPSVVPDSADPALGINGSLQGLLMRKLGVNRAGAVAVVSSTFKKNEASRIWLIRGKAAKR
jgi:hypothetical protein